MLLHLTRWLETQIMTFYRTLDMEILIELLVWLLRNLIFLEKMHQLLLLRSLNMQEEVDLTILMVETLMVTDLT